MPGEILGRTTGAQFAVGFSAKAGHLVDDPVLLVLHLHAIVRKELPEDRHVLHVHLGTVNLVSRLLLTQALGHGKVLAERLLHTDRVARFLREGACRRQVFSVAAAVAAASAPQAAGPAPSSSGAGAAVTAGAGVAAAAAPAPSAASETAPVPASASLRAGRRHGSSY